MKKISILMAVYNAEKTLDEAVASILAQTYQNWQFIICDDCSTDGTYDKLLQYKEQYPDKFVIIKNETNSKLAYSLNHCLQYADGEYIARMDADDISLPERFERQVEYLDAHSDIAVVGTSMIRFDENGDFSELLSYQNPDRYILKTAVPYFHATIMMRKEAMDIIGGYTVAKRTERGQDLDLWFKFYANELIGANLVECLYKVREDRDAIKRRKLKYDLCFVKTRLIGFKLLKFPFAWKIYAIKPVLSHFIPYKLKVKRRNKQQAKTAEARTVDKKVK
jgi:glycosyltransferase EpsE